MTTLSVVGINDFAIRHQATNGLDLVQQSMKKHDLPVH